jgi:hypothetical protein
LNHFNSADQVILMKGKCSTQIGNGISRSNESRRKGSLPFA